MTDINKTILIGRVVKDAELKKTNNNVSVCNFAIAVNRDVKVNDKFESEASFIDLTIWDKFAEKVSAYLKKGTVICVEGYLHQAKWEKDGVKHFELKNVPQKIQLLKSPKEEDYNKDAAQEIGNSGYQMSFENTDSNPAGVDYSLF